MAGPSGKRQRIQSSGRDHHSLKKLKTHGDGRGAHSISRRFYGILKNAFVDYHPVKLIFDPSMVWIVSIVLVIGELFINYVIIDRVQYTEIDWMTYMQQVKCFLGGQLNYTAIEGPTGPLVYPAGHLYVYTMFYYVTSAGVNVRLAQIIFAVIYVVNLVAVFRIYSRIAKVPPYGLMLMCLTSYRVHSIYLLRLFNDPIAILFLYLAVNMFIDHRWSLGCVFYSIAVSIKMNILLFAPALFILLLEFTGWRGSLVNISICATIQLLVGTPFLVTDPLSYVNGAFNFGRVFLHTWTVNWRFLPEDLFVHQRFHISLLAGHLLVLLLFFGKRCITWFKWFPKKPAVSNSSTENILFTLFAANFIGVTFARSLHYQFYVWYYHSLPLLLWLTPYATVTKLCILGLIELCWNTYPSTAWSSGLLHACHVFVLIGLFKYNWADKKQGHKKHL